jgi:hypothetical protein
MVYALLSARRSKQVLKKEQENATAFHFAEVGEYKFIHFAEVGEYKFIKG